MAGPPPGRAGMTPLPPQPKIFSVRCVLGLWSEHFILWRFPFGYNSPGVKTISPFLRFPFPTRAGLANELIDMRAAKRLVHIYTKDKQIGCQSITVSRQNLSEIAVYTAIEKQMNTHASKCG